MAKYIIDTSTCIEYFKHRNGVPERMAQESRDNPQRCNRFEFR